MSPVTPRHEFRAFGPNFGLVESRMRSLSPPPEIRESAEIYLLSTADGRHNIKVRDNLLDVKVLLGTRQRLEQWTPTIKLALPAEAAELEEQVLPLIGLSGVTLDPGRYPAPRLVEVLTRPSSGVIAAQVFKRRFGFRIADCACELADITVNGAAIRTASVESENPELALQVIAELGLDEYDNTSYVLALRRVTGLAPLGA
jgi:hypothetical protein